MKLRLAGGAPGSRWGASRASSWLPRTVLVGLALTLTHCASARVLIRPEPTNAQDLYDQSMEDLTDGLYPEALKGFADLKAKYPYTKFSALADLRTADTHLERGKHIEAVDAYRNFLKFHPNHEEAPYAMMQIGEAYFSQIPDDWFFMPPAAEKEQANVKLALTAFEDMVARYPDSKVTKTAQDRIKDCQRKLAEHELYVADFYFSRDVFAASAGRAEAILSTYPGVGFDEEALWIAGWSRYQTGELEKAVEHLKRLKAEFPESGNASTAGEILRTVKPPPEKKESETKAPETKQPETIEPETIEPETTEPEENVVPAEKQADPGAEG